jgi:hypothetical protein
MPLSALRRLACLLPLAVVLTATPKGIRTGSSTSSSSCRKIIHSTIILAALAYAPGSPYHHLSRTGGDAYDRGG